MEEEAPTELGQTVFTTLVCLRSKPCLLCLDDELPRLAGMAIVPTYPSDNVACYWG